MTNNKTFREVRQYQTGYHLVRYYFVTGCYNSHTPALIRDLSSDPYPDVIIMNSCLWDVSRLVSHLTVVSGMSAGWSVIVQLSLGCQQVGQSLNSCLWDVSRLVSHCTVVSGMSAGWSVIEQLSLGHQQVGQSFDNCLWDVSRLVSH